MTNLENAIIVEINKLRQDPSCYTEKLEQYMQGFEGLDEMLYKQEGRTSIKTKDGKAAVQEAIEYLERAQAVNELQHNDGLSKAAAAHA